MKIFFKFSPQNSDHSRTYYNFDLENRILSIQYQNGESVVVKESGLYVNKFIQVKETTYTIAFSDIVNQKVPKDITGFITDIRVQDEDEIWIELLKQYGADKSSDEVFRYSDWYELTESTWDYQIEDLQTILTNYEILIIKWEEFLSEINSQMNNLTIDLKNEITRLNIKKPSAENPVGSPITIRALKNAILSLQFNYLETMCNYIADIIINLHENIDGSTGFQERLINKKLNLVREVDDNSNRRYTPITDKLKKYPKYLASMFKNEFEIDTQGNDWQNLLSFKDKRDSLTHTRITAEDRFINLSVDTTRPDIQISDGDLLNNMKVIEWYKTQIQGLFRLINLKGNVRYENGLEDMTFRMVYHQLHILNQQSVSIN